jgi:PAS domain S-box-containing protein
MEKEDDIIKRFTEKENLLRIWLKDTPFIFYGRNFDLNKLQGYNNILKENIAKALKGENVNKIIDIEIDGKKRTFRQIVSPLKDGREIFGALGLNIEPEDKDSLIEELKKSIDIHNTFYKFSKEGIYRMEFENPIPVSLPIKKQIELFYKNGYLAECNESLANMYGYETKESITGKRLIDFHKDENNKINFEANKAFIESDYKIYDVQTEEIDKNGNIRYYLNNAVGIIEEGKLARYWGTQIDITERMKTEKALRESEERYRLLVEHSPEAIAVHSGGIIVYVNDSMVNLLKAKSPDELLGKEVMSFVHKDYKEIVNDRIKKTQEEKVHSGILEEKFIACDGKTIDVEVTALPFIYNGIASTQVVVRNVTRRKKDEKIKSAIYKISELAHSINTLDELYKSVHEIVSELMPAENFYIALFDEDTNLISFPYFVDEIDDKPEPKKPGKGLTEYVIKTGKPLLANPSVFNKLMESNEVESIGADSVDWLGVPLIIKDNVIGVLVVQSYSKGIRYKQSELNILNFISEQIAMSISAKKSEEELIKAKTSAEEASKLKSTLLSNMSHELRTPMNGILGFTEIILEESEDTFIRELAQYIQVSGKRLMKTLNSIMDLSQLESGQAILNYEEFDLIGEIQSVINSFIPIANQKNLYLNFVHPQFIINIYSDKNIIQQVVSNLIDNALKFTSTGGVTVEANMIKMTEHKIVDIKVTDSGIGIAPEYKDHIFKEFRQVSEGLKRNYEGSGLGLSLTKKMVTLLKGKIVFESIPGKGSIFNIILPITNTTENLLIPEKNKFEYDVEYISDAPKNLSSEMPVILLVEDNEISIKLTRQFLSKTCRMDFTKIPDEAIRMVEKKKYDLVLMDINLGNEVDGLQLTQQIRRIKGYESTPIIAVTGYALRGDKERIINGGCTDYIKKPFEKAALIEIIKKYIIKLSDK